MKYLKYENQKKIGEIQLKTLQANFKPDLEAFKEINRLHQLLCEKEESFQIRIQQLKMTHNEEISQMRNDFKNKEREFIQLNEEKWNTVKNDIQMQHEIELSEVVERKDAQIKRLIDDTDRDFDLVKTYYEQRTLRQLFLIETLEKEINDLRDQIKQIQLKADEAIIQNQFLAESLEKAKEGNRIEEKLHYSEKEKARLSIYKLKCKTIEKELYQEKLEKEALLMLNNKLNEERDRLKEEFENFIMKSQQEALLKGTLLEKHIRNLQDMADNHQKSLNKLLEAEGNSIDLEQLNTLIKQILYVKDEIIKSLHCEVVRVMKTH